MEADINSMGETRIERRLNKLLYETTLELISYQDAYDKMISVDDIKVEVERLKRLLSEEYIDEKDRNTFIGSLKALEWVLNGSETKKEKLDKIPHSSKGEVIEYIRQQNNKYKQMSLEDYGIDLGGTNE